MTLIGRIAWLAVAGIGVVVLVCHHAGYLLRRRAYSFGAFLSTGGWLIVTLMAVATIAYGWDDPNARAVDVAAGIVGLGCILVGWRIG